MADFSLKGMGVALVTPFKADKTIDFEALERLLDFHLQSDTDFLVVLGTTAETATLSFLITHYRKYLIITLFTIVFFYNL